MATSNIPTFLKFANLQMGAEAILPKDFSGSLPIAELIDGNTRNSKFPDPLAKEFSDVWEVVAHQENTATGFSGTLFRALDSRPQLGITKNELVLSFRSTEFVDDATRDSQATNVLEIKELGWAFGQIDDMMSWFDGLQAQGLIGAGQRFSVAGYSLSGHLAAAFNVLLRDRGLADQILATYTFNGAGTGTVESGTLSQVMDVFRAARQDNTDWFQTTAARDVYLSLRTALTIRTDIAAPAAELEASDRMAQALGQISAAKAAVALSNAPDLTAALAELDTLAQAVVRARSVVDEAYRVRGISDANNPPKVVDASDIAGSGLDYQLAALRAGQHTASFKSEILDGLGAAYSFSRELSPDRGGLSAFFDLYGAPLPSAVANSQYHWGESVPVFIEDQPLTRGNFTGQVVWNSNLGLLFGEAKLLHDNYSVNAFGDTHSLVLLVDSLSVMNTFAQLDRSVSLADMAQVFKVASNVPAVAEFFTRGQGQAEGDVLEQVVNALGRVFGLDQSPEWVELNASVEGNTWHIIENKGPYTGRDALHKNLALIADSAPYQRLLHSDSDQPSTITVHALDTAQANSFATDAKEQFGDFLALKYLVPFNLNPNSLDPNAETTLNDVLSGAHPEDFATWTADKETRAQNDPLKAPVFSDTWYADRAKMLGQVLARNLNNQTESMVDFSADKNYLYEDKSLKIQFNVDQTVNTPTPEQVAKIVFGGAVSEELEGNQKDDHLYGQDGNDTLKGLDGNDYLEGGAGADTLEGGADADVLIGGADADSLDGGTGNDRLYGGAGFDTYVLDANFGHDIIIDSDQSGKIQLTRGARVYPLLLINAHFNQPVGAA